MRRALLVGAVCSLIVPVLAFAVENPLITVPADMTVQAQFSSGATVSYSASAVDSRGRAIPITCVPASGTIFGFGPTTVTCTAQDSAGHIATKQFNVTVVDTRPPVITIKAPSLVKTTSRKGILVRYKASASDLVDGPVAVACVPAPRSRFPVGLTRIACSAADIRTNGTSATFDVAVVLITRRAAQSAAMISPPVGARISVPPLLLWRAVPRARFYNVQLYRRGQKVLSVWPGRSRYKLHGRWRYNGHAFRFRPGRYVWLVWPAFGSQTRPHFGKLLGMSSFVRD
jgi:HYR domain